jgi:hypothetical protein
MIDVLIYVKQLDGSHPYIENLADLEFKECIIEDDVHVPNFYCFVKYT